MHTKEQRNKMILQLAMEGKNITEISQLCACNATTVRRILKKSKIIYVHSKPYRDQQILNLAYEGRDIVEICRLCNCSSTTVRKVVKNSTFEGFDRLKKKVLTDEICKMLDDGLGVREIAKRLNITQTTVFNLTRRVGHHYGTKETGRRILSLKSYNISLRDIEIIELIDQGNTFQEVANKFHLSRQRIHQIYKKNSPTNKGK